MCLSNWIQPVPAMSRPTHTFHCVSLRIPRRTQVNTRSNIDDKHGAARIRYRNDLTRECRRYKVVADGLFDPLRHSIRVGDRVESFSNLEVGNRVEAFRNADQKAAAFRIGKLRYVPAGLSLCLSF